MTWALCFHCGAIKFGAICPCLECKADPPGDMSLDIAFSDHHMSQATLRAFGEVIRSIRRVCDDDRLRFWSFIYFVSTNHPNVLRANLTADLQQRCTEVLARAKPPSVTIEEPKDFRCLGDLRGVKG